MKNLLFILLSIISISIFSCKTKDVNRMPRHTYINEHYKELKDLLPEAEVTIIKDTIKVLFPNNLLFQTNEHVINSSTQELMQRLANCVNKFNKTSIMVCGHTDNVGQPEYNQELSQKRADAAMNVLINNKVAKERLHAWGFGHRQPLVENTSDENKALNRRVEFIILINENAVFKK